MTESDDFMYDNKIKQRGPDWNNSNQTGKQILLLNEARKRMLKFVST